MSRALGYPSVGDYVSEAIQKVKVAETTGSSAWWRGQVQSGGAGGQSVEGSCLAVLCGPSVTESSPFEVVQVGTVSPRRSCFSLIPSVHPVYPPRDFGVPFIRFSTCTPWASVTPHSVPP